MEPVDVEAVAYALLQEHCSVLDGILTRLHHLSIRLPGLPGSLLLLCHPNAAKGNDRSFGARLRLALDIVNACCACKELNPATNSRFWQRVMTDFWSGGYPLCCISESEYDFTPLCEHSLARYLLIQYAPIGNCLVFWKSFLRVDVSEVGIHCDNAYQDAFAKLRPHITSAVRSLTITVIADGDSSIWEHRRIRLLGIRFRAITWYNGGSQGKIVQKLALYANFPGNTLSLRLFARHSVNSPRPMRLHEIWNLAMALQVGPCLSVDHLELALMDFSRSAETVWSQLVPIGALLRAVFFHGNANSLKAYGVNCDIRLIGAVLSVVPDATTLALLEIAELLIEASDRLLRLAWLMYATHHPRRSADLALKITASTENTTMNASELQYVDELLREQIPLRDVIVAMLDWRYGKDACVQVDCFSLGSTARIAGGTALHREPGRSGVEYAVASLVHDECLDVVARVSDGSVGVVYPGYGLVWVDPSAVTWEVNAKPCGSTQEEKLRVDELSPRPAVSSFTIRYGFSQPQVRNGSLELLPLFFGSTLQTLDVHGTHVSRVGLQETLRSCPHLHALMLRSSYVESLTPLVEAYTSTQGCRVSSLTLSDFIILQTGPEHSLAAIFSALAQATHPMAVTIRELHVDLLRVSREDFDLHDYKLLVRALEQPRVRLQRVTVNLQRRGSLTATSYAALTRLKGRQLSDPPPLIILATLCVLRVRAPHVCHEGIIRTILWLVGGSAEQSLGWSLS